MIRITPRSETWRFIRLIERPAQLVIMIFFAGLLQGCGLIEIFGEAFVPESSRIWYVAPDGDDGTAEAPNDCRSEARPCLRINYAISLADPGRTVQLAPGRYVEFYTGITTTVYIDKALTLRGAGAESTIIQVHDSWTGVTAISDEEIVIEGVTIEGGGPDGVGYGALLGGPVILRDSVIRNNQGGGIDAFDGVSIENVAILGNEEFGIYVHSSGTPVTIKNSLIADNQGFGVQIGVDCIVSIVETTIRGNRFPSAVAIGNSGILNVQRSTISGNVATISMGGSISNHGRMTLRNTTISGNQGQTAVANFGDLIMIHTTIANNSNVGLFMGGGRGNLELRNSLIANNGGHDCSIILNDVTTVFRIGTNLDSDQSCLRPASADRSEIEILLGPLAENGGPTMTHALPAGSLAIDAAWDECLEFDQRGVARPVGATCDVGAFEAEILTGAEIVVPIAGEAPPGFPLGPVNCRSGPGAVYGTETYFDVADELSLLARDPEAAWLEVQGSDEPPCWVNRDLLEIDPEFNLMDLPAGVVKPTPTWTAEPETDEPDPGPKGCQYYDGQQNIICYPIDQCPVPFGQSFGACTP